MAKKPPGRAPAGPHGPRRRGWPTIAAAAVIAVGGWFLLRSAPAGDVPGDLGEKPAPRVVAQEVDPPDAAPAPARSELAFRRAEGLPPLPAVPFPAARPYEMVRAAYEFAARHPEVLSYVPCFCGCEEHGHVGNDDCFVAARHADGGVVWDPHGMG